MGTIVRDIINDIETELKQTFDDRKISQAAVAYWVIMIGNKLKGQHIAKRDSGAFMHTYVDVPIQRVAQSMNPDLVKTRQHVKLPAGIFDYDKDDGIAYVAYTSDGKEGCPPKFTQVTFYRTTPSKAEVLYYSDYEKPSPKNPYFYRTGDYIYFLGLECVDVKTLEMGLYTTLPPVREIDIDAPIDFPEELLSQLKREVLDLARFSALVPEELRNDGAAQGNEGGVPMNKLVSVQPQQQPNT